MNNKETNGTKIVVLGGLGEVGKNMYCIISLAKFHDILVGGALYTLSESVKLISSY